MTAPNQPTTGAGCDQVPMRARVGYRADLAVRWYRSLLFAVECPRPRPGPRQATWRW